MAQVVALERDGAAGVAPGLDGVAEGRGNVAQLRLEPVARAAQALHPGIGRGVGFRVAHDDGRGVGCGMLGNNAVEAGLVDRHLAAGDVAPGAGAADVDPAVERAHARPQFALMARGMGAPEAR